VAHRASISFPFVLRREAELNRVSRPCFLCARHHNLRATTAALDRSKFRNVPLYVTQANLNGTRDANTFLPADVRTAQMVSGAWWARF
jgi:hypothetical protein